MVKKMRIIDFARVTTGGTPSTSKKEYWQDGTIPWLNSGELNQEYITKSRNFITHTGLKNSNAKLMPPNTVLIALTGATTGKVGYLTFEACANQSVTGILPSKHHHPKYLYYYLSSIRAKVLNDSYGGAQKHISQSYVQNISVPLPPLPVQQKIAAILDKADSLRQIDKQLLKFYDDLTESVFYEIFGDPDVNNKSWQKRKLAEIGALDRGVSKNRPRNAPELLGGPYPLVQTGDIANADLYLKRYSSTYSETGLKQSKMWPKGTLCITIAANIGRTAILDFDACFPDSVVGFIPNKDSTAVFVKFWFNHIQERLEKAAPESAQKNINLEILRNLTVPVPPINLQLHFANIIDRIESQKLLVRQNISNHNTLYESLLQRAFNGTLVQDA